MSQLWPDALAALGAEHPGAGAALLVVARVSRPPMSVSAAESTLSSADIVRVQLLRREEDRSRSRLGLAIARSVIGAWTNTEPSALSLLRSTTGKPSIAGAHAFSIAHAGDRVVVAFTGEGHVGVDVERVQPGLDLDGIAARCWHTSEMAVWDRVVDAERLHWFYRHWTAKEAVVKALGLGVDDMPAIACDSWSPAEATRVCALPRETSAIGWSLVLFQGDAEYPMALASDRPVVSVRVVDV
jgi:4'-phosphopantetheinyl transferase